MILTDVHRVGRIPVHLGPGCTPDPEHRQSKRQLKWSRQVQHQRFLCRENADIFPFVCSVCLEVNVEFHLMSQGMRWYHLFALFWGVQFIVACQHVVIAGAIAVWYFTRYWRERVPFDRIPLFTTRRGRKRARFAQTLLATREMTQITGCIVE